jgi:hypothetical protein
MKKNPGENIKLIFLGVIWQAGYTSIAYNWITIFIKSKACVS